MTGPDVILGEPAFERRFGNLYRSLYRGDEPFKESFCDSSWQFILKTKRFEWDAEEFEKIFSAAKAVGDTHMVWTNLEFKTPHSISCVLPLDYLTYVEAMQSEELVWLHAGRKAIFGPGGCWAAIVDEVTYFSGGFALFGGVTRFVDEIINLSGGIKRMRQDFVALLDDPTADVPPNLRQRLLDEVGWD